MHRQLLQHPNKPLLLIVRNNIPDCRAVLIKPWLRLRVPNQSLPVQWLASPGTLEPYVKSGTNNAQQPITPPHSAVATPSPGCLFTSSQPPPKSLWHPTTGATTPRCGPCSHITPLPCPFWPILPPTATTVRQGLHISQKSL